jgi:AcrR family transcriptional regulator
MNAKARAAAKRDEGRGAPPVGGAPAALAGEVPAAAPHLRPPQQARSRATYRRLLDAAEELIAAQSFDDTTVAAIVARAGLSAGAFYARFRDKEGLFRHLEERAFAEVRETVRENLAATDGLEAGELLARLIEGLAAVYLRRRAVIRALILRSHADPELRARLDAVNRENQSRVTAALRRALLASSNLDPQTVDARLELALLVQRSALRSILVFHERYHEGQRLDAEFVTQEISRMLIGYLGLPQRRRSG